MGRSPVPARSTAPSMRCSARSCCAPARIRFSRRARGLVCSIRSSAARRPARRRSISPAMANWCARPTSFSPAAAGWCSRNSLLKWTRPRRRSISNAPRSIATGWRRCRRSPRTRASIRARSRRPTCSPCIRPAAIPASRCSSSAPGRTGATAPISRRPIVRSARAKCWARSWRSSTTTSRRRGWCWSRTISRNAICWRARSRPRAGARSR